MRSTQSSPTSAGSESATTSRSPASGWAACSRSRWAQDGADVGFDLSDDQPLLDTTQLVMRYQNLLGQRYLALVQSDDDRGVELAAGARCPWPAPIRAST